MSEPEAVSLDTLDGFQFEKFCQRIFEKLGYGRVSYIGYVGDEGRDLIIEGYKGDRAVVECKHQPDTSIGRPIVQKLHSATLSSKARYAFLVTTGRFSKDAVEYARKLQGISIELIDLPLLNDLAERAGIRILRRGESSPVETLFFSDKKGISNKIFTSLLSPLVSAPASAEALMSIEPATLEFRSAYLINFNIHEDFVTSVGRIHSVHADNQGILVNGTNGAMLDPELSRFILASKGVRGIAQGPPNVKVLRQDFRVDLQSLTDMARKQIIRSYTQEVSYYGRNRRRYRKLCAPGERSVFISNITQLYYPHWLVNARALKHHYVIKTLENPKDIEVVSTDIFTCRVCGREVDEPQARLLCNSCGAIVHRKKSHSFLCEQCGRSVCRSCTFWTRKWGFFKKKICEPCADRYMEAGKNKRRLVSNGLSA